MLPPGHIAAGFLTAKALLRYNHRSLTIHQQSMLLFWGALFGFSPDLDTFVSFAREKAFVVKNRQNNHRKFVSHAPILWLFAGLLIYFLAKTAYVKDIGLLLWLASWSHFILDSIDYGIMWLWPFSKKVYALRNREVNFKIADKTFLGYWFEFLKYYSKTWTFYTEILILALSLIIYFK